MRKDISLYIHIPFCIKKCNYCDFLSFSCTDILEHKEYILALCEEISDYKVVAQEYIVRTIFIGGGTPSLIDKEFVELIMLTVREIWLVSDDAEITIEGNPDSLSHEKLLSYMKVGINRLSIGLQSANNNELKLLGRPHNFDQFKAAYFRAREVGFSNINIDIMAALPGQTFQSYGNTLAEVLTLMPEHISAYSLIVEENTPFFENQDIISMLPNEDVDRLMYSQTKRLLKNSGYSRYEISNYAKKGFECRHNLVYWTGKEYLGFGIGAASLINHERFSNIANIEEYVLKKGKDVYEEKIVIGTKEQMEEYMFLGLRLTSGISISLFQNKFETSIWDVYSKVIEKYIHQDLLLIDGDSIRLTDAGIDISNMILSEFLLD